MDAVRAELTQLRAEFEALAPKFGGYDQMLQDNGPWKATVDTMLTWQGIEQQIIIVEQGKAP